MIKIRCGVEYLGGVWRKAGIIAIYRQVDFSIQEIPRSSLINVLQSRIIGYSKKYIKIL